ncbi:MAG: diguanylate cyclase [Spirochaetales bacterium]|nr:diguanylate cyclase [Spirochaetales bacterium]
MRNTRTHMSIKNTIILVFVLVMTIAASIIAYIIFSGWFRSAEQTVERIADTIGDHLYGHIDSFMKEPAFINEANYRLIESHVVDLSDQAQRERYFVGSLAAFDEKIYSYSYGSATGEYYGARRNEEGIIEIMRNDSTTGGNSWYYSVNEDLTAGEIVAKLGPFDPRNRAWYQAAEQAQSLAYSPVYKHFVIDDLTVSVSRAVYDQEGRLLGVLGTHMLLSDIGSFLADAVGEYDGTALIVEKDTGYVIANSMGVRNFTTDSDGSFQRIHIKNIAGSMVSEAFETYIADNQKQFSSKKGSDGKYVQIRQFQLIGVDWVVILSISGDFLLDQVKQSIGLTILPIFGAVMVLIAVYHILTARLFSPVKNLLQVSASLASGNLSSRVQIVRNDEIGSISKSLNNVADTLKMMVENLEENVEQRTRELHAANIDLQAGRNRLQLILDSTAEGVYGIDIHGNCTFCNASTLKLLGYSDQKELLGKNMHAQLHHSYADGTQFPIEDCKIFKSIRDRHGYEAEDEVFWKADGTSFAVAYHAFPQIHDGEVVGGVITFTDITERKQREEQISYLRFHDSLTGLHNRISFEEYVKKMDIPEHLPLSIIFGDINGLKMTNDIFGHAAGDELIRTSAEILTRSCRRNDMIARFGGDEFVIVLPSTDNDEAIVVIERIRRNFSTIRVKAIKCSISLGTATKRHIGQSLSDSISEAENSMYRDKARTRETVNADIIDTLQKTLHAASTREKQHAEFVREISGTLGKALDVSETEINTLQRAAYLHDIGKVTLDPSLLTKDVLTEEENELMRQHPVAGYRILNLFDDTLDLAEYVYSHHEHWDGGGYPRGLKYEQIPYLSRILAIVETYDRVLHRTTQSLQERKRAAIEVISKGSGTQFDPLIAHTFINMLETQNID